MYFDGKFLFAAGVICKSLLIHENKIWRIRKAEYIYKNQN